MTSISENKMNIRNLVDYSGNLSEKDALLKKKKKIQNTWETIVIFEILKFCCNAKKFLALYHQ